MVTNAKLADIRNPCVISVGRLEVAIEYIRRNFRACCPIRVIPFPSTHPAGKPFFFHEFYGEFTTNTNALTLQG